MTEPKLPPLSYRDAGVDIDSGNALVDRINPFAKSTLRPGVVGGLGGFGGLCGLGAVVLQLALAALGGNSCSWVAAAGSHGGGSGP